MMSPSVRVLGPVAVEARAGATLDLGPARQRAVLVALLMDAGRPVSSTELVDRVWGEAAPPAADQALRSYLCRLRKIAEASAALRLARRDGGYVAEVEVPAFDLALFRELANRARVAVRDGRHAEALDRLEAALALAAGPLLVGVGTDWLDEQRRLLERERHAAALTRNDLALAIGSPDLVVADALGRLAEEPYDERIAGQAVLALAGVGRTREALEVFHQVRLRLDEELGIDPSPALRDIHQRVLRGVETAIPPIAVRPLRPSVPAHPVVPRQLPPAPRGFVDRENESEALDTMVLAADDEPASTVVICGPGGVGKTALAVHWARQHEDRFPDGQLFVDLHGFDSDLRPTAPESALRGLLSALGVDEAAVPSDLAGMVGAYRTLLADRRVLLVADDVAAADQVRLLLPPGRGSAALVTSRSGLPGLVATAAAQVLPVGLLDDVAARELLTTRLGTRRTDAEPASVDRLVRHCGGLALALAIVAGRAAALPSLPLSELAEDLADESRRLRALSGGECRTDLDAVVTGSVATLSTTATSVLEWLAAGPRISIRLAAVAALADLPATDAEDVLRELWSIHLLEPDGPRRFRLHELVRLAVRSRPTPGLDQAVDRLLRFMITESAEGGWEADDLLSAAAYAGETGRHTAQCDLTGALEIPLGSAGRWSELAAINEHAVSAARDHHHDDHRLAAALIGRGRGWIGLREFSAADADLTEALAVAERVADLGLRARAHRALARLGAHQHRWEVALHHDERGLALHRRRGDLLGEAHAHNAIGWHLAHLDRPAEALDSCRQGLAIFVEHHDGEGEALTLDSIGFALDQLGRTGEARAAYVRAAALCRELGRQAQAANTLLRLADTCRRLDDDHEAAAANAEADEILRLSGRQILEP